MCGINLIIDKKNMLSLQPIQSMTAATHHRGPEHNDVLELAASSKVFLGHNRLKIIDRSEASNQPFISSCRRYFLIYNGEIYNFTELRNQLLELGTTFTTYSDTEMLLHLLIKEGVDSLPKLEGMFSFIFYDNDKDEILLARDQSGIKPLYYYNDSDFFIASSETRGIFSSGLVKKVLNKKQIYHYLKFKFSKAPETFFKDINSLDPGHFIWIDKFRNFTIKPYVLRKKPENDLFLDPSQIVKKTEELLVDALSKHISAAVPTGIFLSGGVDSSLLLATIKKAELPMIPSFSIIHKKKEKSFGTQDYIYAKKAAALYGSYQYEVEVDVDDLKDFDDFIQHLDQPIGDSAAFLTYKLSSEAKKNVGVILSGAGADEIFAGYNRHHAFKWYLEHYNFIQKSSGPFKSLLKILPSGFDHPLRKKVQLIKKFVRNCTPYPNETFINFTSLSSKKADLDLSGHSFKDPQDIEGNLWAALKYDQDHFLVSDVLALTDQMSMAYGLEVRVPYLDASLIDFISDLPARQIYSKGRKWILNEMLLKSGGKIFVNRSKEGMGLPFGNWIKNAPDNEALKYISTKKCMLYEFIPENEIQALLKDHIKGKQDNTQELWAIVVLEAWLQKEFK